MAKFTVGLTGGLASGKSTVLDFFRKLGIDTFSADQVVHDLINIDGPAYPKIVDHFGKSILTTEGNIDRAQLRTLIFNSSKEKRWLERYLHPLVRSSLLEQSQKASSAYAVIEVPLLVESLSNYQWLDRILIIDADENTQQLRAQQRSGLSKNDSRQILDQQISRQARNALADDLIINHGSLFELELQVKALHNKYLELSRS